VTSKTKSEGNGVLEKEAPVSNAIGSGFGWSTGTESERVGEATTVVVATTVAVATEVVEVIVGVGSAPIMSCVNR